MIGPTCALEMARDGRRVTVLTAAPAEEATSGVTLPWGCAADVVALTG